MKTNKDIFNSKGIQLPTWMKDTPENRTHLQRVIEVALDDIKQDVDGFYYFDTMHSQGTLSSNDLKIIVWMLDKLNHDWEKHIEEHLTK